MLKKMPDYSDATPLHVGVGISVKCPSGLLLADFLARNSFHHCAFALSKALEKRNSNLNVEAL